MCVCVDKLHGGVCVCVCVCVCVDKLHGRVCVCVYFFLFIEILEKSLPSESSLAKRITLCKE